jgi:hypothetical protein
MSPRSFSELKRSARRVAPFLARCQEGNLSPDHIFPLQTRSMGLVDRTVSRARSTGGGRTRTMKKEFAELPGWSFEVEEKPVGVYRVTATETGGRTFEMEGTDRESLLIDCREEAAALSEQEQFERP